MSNYPPGVNESSPDAPWNQPERPDEETILEAIGEARHLADLLDTMNIVFPPLETLIKDLEAMTYEQG